MIKWGMKDDLNFKIGLVPVYSGVTSVFIAIKWPRSDLETSDLGCLHAVI